MRAIVRCLALGGSCLFGGGVAGGCSGGATGDPALGALMRIDGAQFVRGSLPAESARGPNVDSVQLPTNTIWPGDAAKLLSGSLDPSATAAAVALSGDEGYWIVPAGVADFSAPGAPTFHAVTSFSTALAAGDYVLEVHAVDGNGTFGPKSTLSLTAETTAPSAAPPAGQLVVTLSWDTESDLDLHVVDPAGTEIYYGNRSSVPPPSPEDPAPADAGGGTLDVDSNADCIIDGRRRENVIWAATPPSGRYLVRIDAKSLCGGVVANFTLKAILRGTQIGQARGVLLDSDTWGAHGRGAGLLALTFDVP